MENEGNSPEEPTIKEPVAPPRKPSSNVKWYAIIVALLVIIGGLAVLALYKPAPAAPQVTQATLLQNGKAIAAGGYYNFTINATSQFSNISIVYGDGSHQLVNYSNSNSVSISHQYMNPGEYYIMYTINYTNGNTESYLLPIKVNLGDYSSNGAYRVLRTDVFSSSSQLVNNFSNIFTPGSYVTMDFVGNPGTISGTAGTTNYQIVSQQVTTFLNGSQVSQQSIPYYYSTADQSYHIPLNSIYYTNMAGGYYIVQVQTTTGNLNYTQTVKTQVTGTQSQLYAIPLTGSTNYGFSAGSSVFGIGAQNISYALPVTNLSFLMGDQVTFTGATTLVLSSAANLTLVQGTATYKNATYNHGVNATYSSIPKSDYTVTISSGATLLFNSNVTGMLTGSTLNFTGNYTLGFTNAVVAGLSNTNGASSIASQMFAAGTSFNNMNNMAATFPRTNLTVTNSTDMVLPSGAKTQVVMMTGSNVTLKGTGATISNVSGVVSPTVHGYYLLNASENYTISAGAELLFNSASTTFELNETSTALTFGAGSYTVTLVNDTELTSITSASANFWTPLSYTQVLTGTGTVALNNGQYDQSTTVTTTYNIDVPVFGKVNVPTGAAPSTFTNAVLTNSGFTTLDPAISYFTLNGDILTSTEGFLVNYNGSSSSTYVPELAAYLPSTTNGGINTGYQNYTSTTPWGQTYKAVVAPYTNYTFHIRSNATYQDGSSVTPTDVMYSIARTLLFSTGNPLTPGWIQAQYLLPNWDYSGSDISFYNITQNMTVNDHTNNITFHFQQPMAPSLVFQILAASGAYVTSANWFADHGNANQPALALPGVAPTSDQLPWNSTGFQAYMAQGNIQDYNTYIQFHTFSNGPYELSYVVPNSEVVLVANPNYNPPGPWYPKPSISTIIIQYIPSSSTTYLELKSGKAQTAGIPSSQWNLVQGLEKAGIAQSYFFPSLSLYWYTFNANINTTLLSSITSNKANVPANLFTSLDARKAFAYAWNYSKFLNTYVGNAVYGVNFSYPYAGMLPAGMLYSQSISDLNNTTGGNVPYYDLAMAQHYWNLFLQSSDRANMTGMASDGTYNNAPLYFPVFIAPSDPVDQNGVADWAKAVATFTGHPQIYAQPTSYGNLYLNYLVSGQNPMPISWDGWAPDYPFPTDYLGPMALPVNTSTYPGPFSLTAWFFAGGNTTVGSPLHNSNPNASEAAAMQSMINDFNNGNKNPAQAKYYYQKMNAELVNMTFYVYSQQASGIWLFSTNINSQGILNYQENVMYGGGNILLYNLLSYNK